MLEAIRNYLLECPLLSDDGKLGIEYLSNEPINYSIEEVAGYEPIITYYIDGSTVRQLLFSINSREYFGQDDIDTNLANSKFYEDFSNWLETNNKQKNIPELDGNKYATEIRALSSGYVFEVDEGMKKARYRIQCRLIYEMEEI